MKLARDVALSLLLGALIWAGTGFAAAKLVHAFGGFRFGEPMILPDSYLPPGRATAGGIAAAVLVAVGLLYYLLLIVRSPVGPAVVGGLYFGVSVWAVAHPASFEHTMPGNAFGLNRFWQAPAWGYAMLLAGPLLLRLADGWLRRPAVPAVLLGPLIWTTIAAGLSALAAAVGADELGESLRLSYERDKPPIHNPLTFGLLSVLLLLAAGALFTLLLRSAAVPAGLTVVGVLTLAASAWSMSDPESQNFLYLDSRSSNPFQLYFLGVPAFGYALLLAPAMLVTAFRTRTTADPVPGLAAADPMPANP
jgi:hypothetical protein